MKLSSEEELLQLEIREGYLKEITDTIPEDIAMVRRIKKQFPNLAKQAEECENLCNEIMMQTKDALYRMNNQQE